MVPSNKFLKSRTKGGSSSSNKFSKSRTKGGSSSSNKRTAPTLQDQKKNYATRLRNIGVDPEDVADSRNWLEKKLNLKKDQNVLFDIFEIINRPQNALFGGIDEALSGGDFKEGLSEGWKGEKDTTGKDLLVNHAGMKDREGKLDLADVLGFGLDVVADPLDLALIPVSGGTSAIAKAGLEGVQDASKIAKGVKTAAKTADTINDARKVVDTASDVVKESSALSRILTKGANKVGDTGLALQSPTQMIFNTLGEGVRGTGKVADKLITGANKIADSKVLRKAEKIIEANPGLNKDDIIRELGGANGVENWEAAKKALSNIFNPNSKAQKTARLLNQGENEADIYRAQAETRFKELFSDERLNTLEKTLVDKYNIKPEKAKDLVYNSLAPNKQYDEALKAFSGSDVAKEIRKTGKFEFGDKKSYNLFKKSLDKNKSLMGAYDAVDDLKTITFKKDRKSKEAINAFFGNKANIEDLSKGTYKKASKNAPEIDKLLKENRKYIENIPELKALDDDYRRFFSEDTNRQMAAATKGRIQSPIAANEGYAPGVLTREYQEATAKTTPTTGGGKGLFNLKENKAKETQNMLQANFEAANPDFKNIDTRIKAETSKLSQNAKDRIISKENKLYENYEKEMTKLNKRLSKLEKKDVELAKSYELHTKMADDIRKTLQDFSQETVRSSSQRAGQLSALDSVKKYNNAEAKLNKVRKQMMDSSLDDNTLAKLNKQRKGLEETMQKSYAKFESSAAIAQGQIARKEDALLRKVDKGIDKSIKESSTLKETERKIQSNLDEMTLVKQAMTDKTDALAKNIEIQANKMRGIDPAKDAITKETIKRLNKTREVEQKLVKDMAEKGYSKFNLDFRAGIESFIGKNEDFIKASRVYGDAILNGTFLDKDILKFAEDFAEKESTKGFVKVNGNDVANQLYNIKSFLPDDTDTIEFFEKQLRGKSVYLDANHARLLGFAKASKNGDAHALVKMVDGINNTFKKFKTMTPGFHVRNWAGNTVNSYLAGVPIHKIPEYQTKAIKVMNSSSDIMNKISTKGIESLSPAEKANWDLLQEFYSAFGMGGKAATGLQDLEKVVSNYSKSPINLASKAGVKANEFVDGANRMAVFMYAKENPKFVEKLGKKSAADAARYALMDPTNVSEFESKVMKRVIPFYTFTKQNLIFQATNIMQNAPKYNKLMKAINSTYRNLEDDEYYGFQKDNMQIPTPFKDEDGNRLFLKANLPLSDLGEFMSSPLNRTVSSLSPLIKTPFEMVTGVDTFTGQKLDTKNTASEAAFNVLGIDMPQGLKTSSQKAEHILSSLGLDTITTNMVKKVAKVIDGYNGEASGTELWGEILRSLFQNTNQEKIENSRLYEEMEAYQNYIKSLKNQGIDVPTIREINAANKIKLNRISNKRKNRRTTIR